MGRDRSVLAAVGQGDAVAAGLVAVDGDPQVTAAGAFRFAAELGPPRTATASEPGRLRSGDQGWVTVMVTVAVAVTASSPVPLEAVSV